MPVHITYNVFMLLNRQRHDDVIKWKHFPVYWSFMQGIHRSPVTSLRKGQCRGALMFSLICARINGWVNTGEAGDWRRHHAHYDVIVMALTHLRCIVFTLWCILTSSPQAHILLLTIQMFKLHPLNLISNVYGNPFIWCMDTEHLRLISHCSFCSMHNNSPRM